MQSTATTHTKALEQLAAIKANDEEALRLLYQGNFFKVETYILRNSGNREQAKDIYQDAFIAVWRNIQLDKFVPETESSIDGYLYRIAKNKWMDYLRSGHNTRVIALDDAPVIAEAAGTSEEENVLLSLIRKNVGSLGDNCRKVLGMFYYQNISMRKIAEEMGWTEATARNNKYRCIQKLRELIKHK